MRNSFINHASNLTEIEVGNYLTDFIQLIMLEIQLDWDCSFPKALVEKDEWYIFVPSIWTMKCLIFALCLICENNFIVKLVLWIDCFFAPRKE